MKTIFVVPLIAVIAIGGCASVKPGLGFDDVQKSVAQRTGARTHWKNGSAQDAEVNAAISAMLKKDLTAAEAVQIALLNNHNLQAVYEELNLAQADLVQAGLLRNPIFSGEIRFATSGSGTGVALDVAQDFISLFSMPLRKQRAAAAFEAAKVRVTTAVLDQAFDVRTAFYDYVAAEQAKEMRSAVQEATGASLELAQRLRSAGNFRELDVLNQESLHQQAIIDLGAAEALVTATRERLNALMGLSEGQTQWHAAARLPEVPETLAAEEGMTRKAVEASLDLSLLRREAEVAARTAGISKTFAWMEGSEVGVAADRELEGQWSVGPAISLPLPLFNQGQPEIAAAQARFKQAAERAIARETEIAARVRAAHSAVVSSHARTRQFEKTILPLQQRILEQTQLQYNAMQVSAFQLLQAKRDQINAGGQYIDSVHEYWRAQAALDQVLSGRMTPFERGGTSWSSSTPTSGTGEHQ